MARSISSRSLHVLALAGTVLLANPMVASATQAQPSSQFTPQWSVPANGLPDDSAASENRPAASKRKWFGKSSDTSSAAEPSEDAAAQTQPDDKGPGDSQVLLQPHMQLESRKNSDAEAPKEITKDRPAIKTDVPESTSEASDSKESATKVIQAQVSVWDSPNIDKIVNQLVDQNYAKTAEAQRLEKQVKHFQSPTLKVWNRVQDALDYSISAQGFNPSKRMGELVLNDKAKVRDDTTAEYERQKYIDKIHAQVVSSMMELAMGLGTEAPSRRDEIVNSGLESLNVLVGEEQADITFKALKTWLAKRQVPDSVFKTPAWDTIEREQKLEQILEAALSKDPVVKQVRAKVQKYASPGQVKVVTSQVVEGALNALAIGSQGFGVSLGAEAALVAYVQATGGSENRKLEKELVLDKRIQSRLRVLNQEATLALDNYRFATVTHNVPLLTFSQAVVSEMTTDDVASQVLIKPEAETAGLGKQPDPKSPLMVPDIEETKNQQKKSFANRLLGGTKPL